MDEEARECLHKVLAYMLESEAQAYHNHNPPHRREGWAYESALWLMRHFDFGDLTEADASVRSRRAEGSG